MAMNPFKRNKPEPDPADPRGAEPGAAGSAPADPSAADAAARLDTVDETAALIDDLSLRVDALTRERDAAQEAHKRALAEFQNYQRRSLTNEQQAREFGVRGVLQSVMPVVDHFDMALGLDAEKTTAKQVMGGVAMIKDELLRVLGAHGVAVIRPAPGDAFDPNQHEAIVHVPASTVGDGCVVATLRLGYSLSGRVVRPAQVSIAKGAENPGCAPDGADAAGAGGG
ncbi:MAG: nucleotide exchange factor GrpE [Phycisphaerales bacterium]